MPPSQQDMPPHGGVPKRPRLGGSRPPQHPNQSTSNLRGLTDLLGATTSRADSALGDSAPEDAWSSITKTVHELPSVQLPPIEQSIDAPPQQAHVLPSAYGLQNLTHLPLDLSLKTRMRITSNVSLLWTSLRSPRDAYAAMQDVLTGNDRSLTALPAKGVVPNHMLSNGSSQLHPPRPSPAPAPQPTAPNQRMSDAHALFNRRLINFRFPSNVISTTLASAWHNIFVAGKPVSRDEQMNNRLRAEAYHRLTLWQTAFQSIFFGFKGRNIDHFYVIIQGSVVLFHRNSDDQRTPIALLSPASAGVRSLLSDFTVQFSISRVDAGAAAGTDDVYVKVKGEFNVHTLYNFILGVGHKVSGSTDVPTLICDRPFIGGTALVASVDCARMARTDANALGDIAVRTAPAQHSVQIRGYLTPRQLDGICQALAVTQSSNYKAVVETDRFSTGLNNLFVALDREDSQANATDPSLHRRGETISEVAAFPDMNGLFVQATAAPHSS